MFFKVTRHLRKLEERALGMSELHKLLHFFFSCFFAKYNFFTAFNYAVLNQMFFVLSLLAVANFLLQTYVEG